MKKFIFLAIFIILSTAVFGKVWVANYVHDNIVLLDGEKELLKIDDKAFMYPIDIQQTPNGIWVADKITGDLYKYDNNGKKLFTFSNGNFRSPRAISYNPLTEGVWVAFSKNIVSISKEGEIISFQRGFVFPQDLVSTPEGEVYVADTNADRIVKLDSDAKIIKEKINIKSPEAISYNPLDGGLWVASDILDSVMRYDSELNELYKYRNLIGVYDLSTDPKTGGVWITDRDKNTLIKLSKSGREVCKFNDFRMPSGISAEMNGVWVADMNNGEVVFVNQECFETIRTKDIYPSVDFLKTADYEINKIEIIDEEEINVNIGTPPGPIEDEELIIEPKIELPKEEIKKEPKIVEEIEEIKEEIKKEVLEEVKEEIKEEVVEKKEIPEITGSAVKEIEESKFSWVYLIAAISFVLIVMFIASKLKK